MRSWPSTLSNEKTRVYDRLCVNCRQSGYKHVDGKCLFQASSYEAPVEVRVSEVEFRTFEICLRGKQRTTVWRLSTFGLSNLYNELLGEMENERSRKDQGL